MFPFLHHTPNVSLRVSEVLNDIGVSEEMVLKRRRIFQFTEFGVNISVLLSDVNRPTYVFGSQSEGTTTWGLKSDTDQLVNTNWFNVIQDLCEWETGVRNLLMIQDENVSPGYCLLQLLRDDAPLAYIEHSFIHGSRITVFKNTCFHDKIKQGEFIHGPATATPEQPERMAHDTVRALSCKSWPIQARQWLDRQGAWPSYEMKRYCSNTGCFVVPVGRKGSQHEVNEWRISTSLAERCLMFNLNITQIRSYVLMKMILKTYIKPQFGDTISSFMCKTMLFHCIANTLYNSWREDNLLNCLTLCLLALYKCASEENCPHFIIPENNLMAGFSKETKPYLLEILKYLSSNPGTALLGIPCDELGAILQARFSGIHELSPYISCISTSHWLLRYNAKGVNDFHKYLLTLINDIYNIPIVLQTLIKCLAKLRTVYTSNDRTIKSACTLLVPSICTTLGSVLASVNIHHGILLEAFSCMLLGLNSDVSSGKLKLASVFYCAGDMERTEIILTSTEHCYDLSVVAPICACYTWTYLPTEREMIAFGNRALNHDKEAIQRMTASCIRFLPCEIKCVPKELHQEMFRSSQEDLAFRGERDDWMDWAVVDSLPYLYFLQYKTYKRYGDKLRALSNLAWTIDNEPNYGHRETAVNLLGQCMEQEGRPRDALRCYLFSLNIRARNNAAKIHICRLLNVMINSS